MHRSVKLCLIGFCVALACLWSRDAKAIETRRVAVVDELGNPVAVEVHIEGGGSTKLVPKCQQQRGNDKRKCKRAAENEPEFRLVVAAGRRGADLYGQVGYDDLRDEILLSAHPQAQSSCFEVSLHDRESPNDAFFPPSPVNSERKQPLCGDGAVRYVVNRRQARVELDVLGDLVGTQFEVAPNPAYSVGDVDGHRTISFELTFASEPVDKEIVDVELRTEGHHPISIQIPREELMKTPIAWRGQITAPIAIFEPMILELPEDTKTKRVPPEHLVACVVYPEKSPEYLVQEVAQAQAAAGTERVCSAEVCQQSNRCQPCSIVAASNDALATSCPMWPQSGENRLVLYERGLDSSHAELYSDELHCTPTDGICRFKRYFEHPRSEVIHLHVQPEILSALERGNRAYLTIERVHPSGAADPNVIEIRRLTRLMSKDDWVEWHSNPTLGIIEVEADAFANDSTDVRYNVRVHALYSNYPRDRSALRIATDIDRAALLTLTHDADGLEFPRFGLSMRAYSGPSMAVAHKGIARRSPDGYSLGADPFIGFGVVPELYLGAASFPLQLVLGVEAEPVRSWYVPSVGAPTSSPKWRSRMLLGIGARTRPLPWLLRGAVELQMAWAPEIPGRAQLIETRDLLAIMMIGTHAFYDLLPRYSDRLKLFLGLDAFIGSKTPFEFETSSPARANVRLHVSFGIVMSFDSTAERRQR